jgi:hypothetical protein
MVRREAQRREQERVGRLEGKGKRSGVEREEREGRWG